MSDKIIEACLIYTLVGSLIWMILDGLGIIDNTYSDRGTSRLAMAIATLYMISAWPLFLFRYFRNRRTAIRFTRGHS